MGATVALNAALAGLLALAAQSPPDRAVVTVPPRKSVAGLRGVESISTVVYTALPEHPHQLRATYVFPDRARIWISVGEGQSVARQMRTRLGATVCAIEPSSDRSRELQGTERDVALAQIEMRRALLLWPDGFAWKSCAEGASAELGDGRGSLRADVGPQSKTRPAWIEWLDKDGTRVDAFRSIHWSAHDNREWPQSLELWHGGAKVWSETISAIDTLTRFIDSFFLPPDRREAQTTSAVEASTVRSMDLPRHLGRRIALVKGIGWDDACAEWKRLRAEAEKALGERKLSLEPMMSFEIDAAFKPTAVLLRLALRPGESEPGADLGWPVTGERPGLYTFVIGLAQGRPTHLGSLTRALPSDAKAGVPYVRFDPDKPDGHVMILLPLEARE